jgi:predicted DNA repair protein MutK
MPLLTQVAVLVGIALLMTVGVYGLVAGIVKLDDAGLWLARRGGAQAALGRAILRAAPGLMKALSVAGTAAMFLVGGGIVAHGVPALHAVVQAITQASPATIQAVVEQIANAGVGVLAGALVLAVVTLGQRAWRAWRATAVTA